MSQNTGFRHFRNGTAPGQQHLIHNKGGVTMAFTAPKHIEDLTAADQCEVAFAFCSSADNFERAAGRAVASKRLAEGKSLIVPGHALVNLLRVRSTEALRLLTFGLLTGVAPEFKQHFQMLVKGSIVKGARVTK